MHIVIIGNGISGITTARYVRKMSDHEITVISSETDYFWSRTALMYIYMGHMTFENTQPYEKWFWAKNRIKLVRKHVNQINSDSKTLYFTDGDAMPCEILSWPSKLIGLRSCRQHKLIIGHGIPIGEIKGLAVRVDLIDMFSDELDPVFSPKPL
ncbi:MAG: FAD/NAD(P)-binding oxidoreductase, partial [Bacteroidota bacterium]